MDRRKPPKNLTIINLPNNRFGGSICSELCQLKKIQILNLSSYNISSIIPRCLSNFTAMTKKGSFTVAHNYSFRSHAHKGPTEYFKMSHTLMKHCLNGKEVNLSTRILLDL